METTALDLSALLLDILGYSADEFVSIGHDADGHFRTAVGSPTNAATFVAKLPDNANIYFGVNPVRGPARRDGGRGRAEDVTRLAALWADLDVKHGSCPDIETAHKVIDELSEILGTRPSAITHSGNGLHPYWPVDDGKISSCNVGALLKRWGRLVAITAEHHGAHIDSVFDLPRMLRIPGTTNNKAKTNGHKGPSVVTYADNGGPLTVAEVDERLNEHGIYEEDDDTASTEQVSDPAGWCFADETCRYIAELIDAIPSDGPLTGKGRHQWVLKQAVRLACAYMLGCVSENDWRRAQKLLDKRLHHLRAETGHTVPKFEIPAAMRFGLDKASTKTEQQARAELGVHNHPSHSTATTPDSENPADIHRGHARFAYLLAERETGNLLHVFGIGWFYWDGKRWKRDDKGKARRGVLAVNRQQWQNARNDKQLQADCLKCDTATGVNGTLEIASALVPFAATVDDLDADPFMLNTASGTLDLHTLETRSHRPADRITKLCRGAYTSDTTSAVWDAFLARVLPDEAVRTFVQRLIGLALLGEVREHILPIFTGTGANGKGTFYKAILYALGDYAGTAEPDLFTHRENAHPTGQMDLLGRRFIVVSETDDGKRLAEATMKRLTGGDPITARWMRKDNVTFTPSHLPVLVTNHLPKVSGDDPAIWRRIRVVPWSVVIPEDEQDKTLDAQLQLEADAVLSWAVAGLRDYLNRGLDEPTSVRAATDEYQKRSDAIRRFIDDECHQTAAVKISAGKLFEAWEAWRKLDGSPEISKKAFGQALARLGFTSRESNGKTWWHGICVLKGEEQWA